MSEAKQKPKRRWFRFSLRTLLVVVTILCVALAFWTHRANRQKAVVKWVEENGGDVYYDFEWDEKGNFIADAKPPGPRWLQSFLGNDYLATVVIVSLGSSKVKDIAPLAKLGQLEELSLYNAQISDLTPLAQLTSLQELSLTKSQVSDLKPLAGLSSLRSLWLSDTTVSDLTPLSELKSLEDLNLANTQASDLTPLTGLPRLHLLSLNNTQVCDFSTLKKLTSLNNLHLRNMPVSEVTPLVGLTSLEFIDLYNTQVTQEQLIVLRNALPKCDIFWAPPDKTAQGN